MSFLDRPTRFPRVAAVGLASWDRIIQVDTYPEAGHGAIVTATAELPGGTTGNSAVALARLGADVSLATLVGDDADGVMLREALEREGVDTTWVRTAPGAPTDGATVIVSATPRDRTVYWHQGAHLVLGDRLDITAIFSHDVVLIDVDDAPLSRFLVDLPVHTLPSTRILGTLCYLTDLDPKEALDIAYRYDVLVGNGRELLTVTGQASLDDAIASMQSVMLGVNLRAGMISRGADGATAFTRTERWDLPAFPVDVIDTTGAGDAFAGAVAFGMALRWPWPDVLTFGNAVAGLSTTALGAQTALPTWDQVVTFITERQ